MLWFEERGVYACVAVAYRNQRDRHASWTRYCEGYSFSCGQASAFTPSANANTHVLLRWRGWGDTTTCPTCWWWQAKRCAVTCALFRAWPLLTERSGTHNKGLLLLAVVMFVPEANDT